MKTIKFLILAVLLTGSLHAQSSDEQIQKDILLYVNKYRVEHGLNALKMNPVISEQARQHSQDMATHKMGFGHQYFTDRIKRIYKQITFCRSGAENIAFNYKDTKELVRLWTLSPGHRRNIVGHYNLTGIGVARDSNGKMYYTQMFILAGK